MTFQQHKPYPAGQCFGPSCTASARNEDQALIPRFCSDPCQSRFGAEHTLPAPAAFIVDPPAPPAAVVEIHDGEQWQRMPGIKAVTLHVPAVPDRPTPDAADVQRRLTEIALAAAPLLKEIGRALQRMAEAVRPAIEQMSALARNIPPSEPKARALWLRRNRNTGPASKQRPPRFLDTTSRRRTR